MGTSGGYHGYIGENFMSTSGDVQYIVIMMHVGDTMSTSGDIMSTLGGYHEYIGGGCSVHRGFQ